MVERFGGYGYRIGPTRPQPAKPTQTNQKAQASDQGSFAQILKGQLSAQNGAVKFSAHAAARIQSRGIQLSGEQMESLNDAVDRAASKNCRESLVLMDDLAFVVSVKNRTVITVVDKERMQQNVFTNIDSAVVTR